MVLARKPNPNLHRATNSPFVLVLHLISREGGASFVVQSKRKQPKQRKGNTTRNCFPQSIESCFFVELGMKGIYCIVFKHVSYLYCKEMKLL